MAVPGEITGLAHTSTTDSLTFTWDVQAAADGYQLSLARDGVEVASQDVATAEATFSGLEDGTDYTLTITAYNAEGDGPAATYQATTAYLAPAAPVNLRQFEERIIAVICRWDHPEPDKVHDTEVQLLYGSEIVGQDALEGPATERTFVVPMASTDYLLRVRAGNPGGWSAWAEATVHSETFPLIDSRLGVMAATYQEDVLHPDTWDGGTDAAGVGDPQNVQGGVDLAFLDPVLMPGLSGVGANISVSVDGFSTRVVNKSYSSGPENDGVGTSVAVGSFATRILQRDAHSGPEDHGVGASVSVGAFNTVVALYVYSDDGNHDGAGVSVTLGSFSTEVV